MNHDPYSPGWWLTDCTPRRRSRAREAWPAYGAILFIVILVAVVWRVTG